MALQDVSRRSFLKGIAAVGAVGSIGALAAGCSSPTTAGSANAAESADAGTASWRVAPEAIAEDDIAETSEYDVVIVGGGVSGMCTANSAAEQGLSVAVVEKYTEGRYGGAYFGVIGSRLHEEAGVDIKVSDVMPDLLRENQNCLDVKLISRWLTNSGEAMNWLLDKADAAGLPCFLASGDGYTRTPNENYNRHNNVMDEGVYPGLRFAYDEANPDRDANDLGLACLVDAAKDSGVEIFYETPAVQLAKDGDRVIGVICQKSDGTYARFNASKGVVLASGDFIGDTDMVADLLPWAVDICENNNAYNMVMKNPPADPINTGDGQKMGVWAGGKMQERHHSIMLTGGGSLTGPFLWVNSEGKRFMNENTSGGPTMGAQLTIPENSIAFQIFDSKFGDDMNRIGIVAFDGIMTADEEYVESIKEGAAYKADTIEELAEQIGVDPTTLAETVARKNELAEMGEDVDFGVASDRLITIEEPPFYAAAASRGAFVGLSGLVCTENLEVISEDTGEALPGLFAVGNVVGRRSANIYSTPLCGATNGWAVTDGYLLGKFLAEN